MTTLEKLQAAQAKGAPIEIFNGDAGYQLLEPGDHIQHFWLDRYRIAGPTRFERFAQSLPFTPDTVEEVFTLAGADLTEAQVLTFLDVCARLTVCPVFTLTAVKGLKK